MAHKANEFRQDMPPEGGYRTFNWERTFPRRILRPMYVLPGVALAIAYSVFQNRAARRVNLNRVFEDRDIYNALEPFLKAERDRNWLLHLRKNRELEQEIMKDVPGWVTGTWYGEPVYFTLEEKWWDPIETEFFAHSTNHAFFREPLWRHHSEYAGPKFYDGFIEKWVPNCIKKHIW